MKEKLIIGLTGGIGSGKTAASDYFQTLGIVVIDADVEARAVIEKGSPTLEQIRQFFGDEVLLEDGSLNRSWLRARVFEHPQEREWLESVTHPAIRNNIIAKLAAADSAYSILVSPLLFESGQNLLTHRTLLIDVPEALQRDRASVRDQNTPEQVEAIIRVQMPRQERLEKADDVILNDRDLAHLHQECNRFHQQYLELAKHV